MKVELSARARPPYMVMSIWRQVCFWDAPSSTAPRNDDDVLDLRLYHHPDHPFFGFLISTKDRPLITRFRIVKEVVLLGNGEPFNSRSFNGLLFFTPQTHKDCLTWRSIRWKDQSDH